MARRKVANLLALAVLSVLYQQPMHRYEMVTILRSRGKDQDMDIKWGSFYTVVQNMEKHGFVTAVETTRDGARPERTVYQITDIGRAELVDWTRELISTPLPEHPQFVAGLSVLAVLPPHEAAELLGTRLELLDGHLTALREATIDALRDVPRLFLIENEYRIAMLEAEGNWVRELRDELNAGTFPDQQMWQTIHTAMTERGSPTD